MNEIDVHERLATIEAKLDTLLERDHEKRLSALERWRSYVLGAGAVLAALFSWLVARKP